MSNSISWYINRLRCMSLPEISYRISNKLQAIKETRIGAGAEQVPAAAIAYAPTWIFPAQPEEPSALESAAAKIAEGKLDVFNCKDYDLGSPPQWNTDPKTGTRAPLNYGKTLNYRDENLIGDIKYLWEPSRHLQWVTLCNAYRFNQDRKYLDAFAEQLASWLDQCPYMKGAQWVSSLELGIRLINWAICWQLVGGHDSELFDGEGGLALRDRWLQSIYQHCHFINGHYSRFSSANNHLIGEASGVYIASLTWPYWKSLSRWGERAKQVLEAEASAQNFPDGVNKEQAISYQQFVLDFLLLPYLVARANKQSFSEGYGQIIQSMMEYLAAMLDVRGNMPMVGDADDGYVVYLATTPDFCPYRSLLASGAVIFNRQDFKQKTGSFDEKSFALLGETGKQAFNQLCAPSSVNFKRSFPQGGYYILGSHLHEDDEVRMVVDAGPLGYGGIAAHGHADALSVYMSVAGEEILIDPGTYAYHTEAKWRDYFRGTSAHNTLRIDRVDQSEVGGNFMWLFKAEATVENYQNTERNCVFQASHNGYTRLADPVIHHRSINYDKNSQSYEIIDTISGKSSHSTEQFWHLSEVAEVECLSEHELIITSGLSKVKLTLDSALSVQLISGNDKLPMGWTSRFFDMKVASTSIVAQGTFATASLVTTIEILAD